VSLQRFEHFDVISMVDKSIDHGEIMSIGSFVRLFVTIKFTGFDGHFRLSRAGNKLRPHHFNSMSSTFIDQSAREKSLSYDKILVHFCCLTIVVFSDVSRSCTNSAVITQTPCPCITTYKTRKGTLLFLCL